MELNLVLRFVPRVLTADRITTEIKATSRPYSGALAPVSSLRKIHHLDILPVPSRPLKLERVLIRLLFTG